MGYLPSSVPSLLKATMCLLASLESRRIIHCPLRVFHIQVIVKDKISCDNYSYGGTVKWKHAPPWGAFSAQILPPCASINAFAIESPSPVPPLDRARDLSPR
jgi:hypothetical protein